MESKVIVEQTNLEKLGLTKAAEKLETAKKMKFAYANYLFVTQKKVDEFNVKLRVDTLKEDKSSWQFKHLVFIKLGDYSEIPPASVLEALTKAQDDKCFDTFEVAKIEWIKEVKDPILFGRINGCTDYFFITQWDDDVKFEDILFTEK
jgi:hypothetical protein